MRWRMRRALLAVAGMATTAAVVVVSSLTPAQADIDTATTVTPAGGTDRAEEDDVKLYQLLYDSQFTEPLSILGQKVRILIWLDHLDFSPSQRQQLLTLARKFQDRHQKIVQEQEA